MGNFFSNVGRGLKLALKTVTFHWKQYFCFYVAILAMEIMFGIVVMTSSKNIDQYEANISSQYDYHFALTNIPEGTRAWYEETYHNTPYTPFVVEDANPREEGLGFVYVRINPAGAAGSDEEVQVKTNTEYYDDFYERYIRKAPNMKAKDVNVQFTPLFYIEDTISDMRLECAGRLLILGLVSIAVIILLLNIRLNHFKFTYGIYMSFGADSKKLFQTNFWDMLVIGLLMLIPSALISILATFTLYSGGSFASGEISRFLSDYSWLTAFALLFIIPVCILSVWLPTKLIASKTPLKLLTAQDNSNLVSSPRVSSKLFGKKFPRSYESLGLFRFRRYIATVVSSSVLFASIFVWISFYGSIYNFNIQQEQSEFTIKVNVDNMIEKIEEYVQSDKMKDVTSDFQKARKNVYQDKIITKAPADVAKFESYYDSSKYTIKFSDTGYITTVTENSTNANVYEEYWAARCAVVKEGYQIKGKSDTTVQKLEAYLKGDIQGKQDNKKVEYVKVLSTDHGHVVEVYKKELKVTYKYQDDMLKLQKQKLVDLGYIVSGQVLLKHIDFDLYQTEESTEAGVAITSNYIYVGFDSDNVKAFSGLEYNSTVEKKVTDRVQFYPLDEEGDNLNFLSKYQLDIMGGQEDLYLSDMDGKKYVIISETAANSQVLDIKPGDTIDISYTEWVTGEYDETLKGDDLLAEMIKGGEFKTTETYTVYAVIKDMPTSEKIPIYVMEDDYLAITGVEPIPNMFSLYLPVSTTTDDVKELHQQLVAWGGDFATVEWNNAIAESKEVVEMKNLEIIQTIAAFSLILSPLFWFFSQIMFYGKREEEFMMLRGLGSTEKEIKKIFRQDGLVFSLIGAGATLLFGTVGVFVIHKLNMFLTAFFDFGALTLYRFEMPWISLAIAVAATAVFGYVSTVIPYRIDRKKAKKAFLKEFGD